MMHSVATAANSNRPLWQRVTLKVAAEETALDMLSEVEREALWEKAVATMKPEPDVLQLLVNDEAARNGYMLKFVRAYRAGLPPQAQWVESKPFPSS